MQNNVEQKKEKWTKEKILFDINPNFQKSLINFVCGLRTRTTLTWPPPVWVQVRRAASWRPRFVSRRYSIIQTPSTFLIPDCGGHRPPPRLYRQKSGPRTGGEQRIINTRAAARLFVFPGEQSRERESKLWCGDKRVVFLPNKLNTYTDFFWKFHLRRWLLRGDPEVVVTTGIQNAVHLNNINVLIKPNKNKRKYQKITSTKLNSAV